jgi:hypothetical protein
VPPQFFKARQGIFSAQRNPWNLHAFQTSASLEIAVSQLLPKTGLLFIGEFFHVTSLNEPALATSISSNFGLRREGRERGQEPPAQKYDYGRTFADRITIGLDGTFW